MVNDDNPFSILGLVVLGLCAIAALRLIVRRARGDLPLVLVLAGILGLGAWSFVARENTAIGLTLLVILLGFVVGELPGHWDQPLLRARVRRDFARARRAALVRLLLQPSAVHRAEHRIASALCGLRRGRFTAHEAMRRVFATTDPRQPSSYQRAVDGVVEIHAMEARWDQVALMLDGHGGEWLFSGAQGFALIEAHCRCRELAAAAAVVERWASVPAPADAHNAEDEFYRTKARLLFLAHAGRGAIVGPLLDSRSATGRRLFPAPECERLAALSRAPARAADPHVDRVAALAEREVRRERSLPDAALGTASTGWAVWLIALACVAIYAAEHVWSDDWLLATHQFGGLERHLVARGEWWRMFAATFLHANAIHLIVNLAALRLIGRVAVHYLGPTGFLLTYLTAGLSGSLAFVALGRDGIAVGASGAIFGLLAASFVMATADQAAPAAWRTRQRGRLMALMVTNLALGFTLPFVSNTIHLGGLVGGAVVGRALVWLRDHRRPWVRPGCRAATATMWVACVGAATVGVIDARASGVPALMVFERRELTTSNGMPHHVALDLPAEWRLDKYRMIEAPGLLFMQVYFFQCRDTLDPERRAIAAGDATTLARVIEERHRAAGEDVRVIANHGLALLHEPVARGEWVHVVRMYAEGVLFVKVLFLRRDSVAAWLPVVESVVQSADPAPCRDDE